MNIFAFTQPMGSYPGYVSINRQLSGDVEITVRSAPVIKDGIHVCAHARDAGPGRCTPGGPTCNNYCNMAPEKGPMQDKPLPATHTIQGSIASMTLPAKEWERLLSGG